MNVHVYFHIHQIYPVCILLNCEFQYLKQLMYWFITYPTKANTEYLSLKSNLAAAKLLLRALKIFFSTAKILLRALKIFFRVLEMFFKALKIIFGVLEMFFGALKMFFGVLKIIFRATQMSMFRFRDLLHDIFSKLQ